jgi:hypothetical protein
VRQLLIASAATIVDVIGISLGQRELSPATLEHFGTAFHFVTSKRGAVTVFPISSQFVWE